MKKICLVCTNADRAGAPIHVATLVLELRELFSIHCVFGESGPIEREIRNLGVGVSVVPQLRSAISPLQDIRCLLALQGIIESIRPHLIHAHGAKAGMVARLVARKLRIPCLYTVHGWGFGAGRPTLQSFFLRRVEKFLSGQRWGSQYVYVSRADELIGQVELGIGEGAGCVIRNGIHDHGRLADPDQKEVIVMAARVAYQKDYETLIRGFDSASWGHLRLVGPGTDSEAFQESVKNWAPRRSSYIECTGPSQNIAQVLEGAAVYALASRYEGLPLSIIEAMCAGLPILATDVGGVRELVDNGRNGFLVSIGDRKGWRNRLEQLSDPALRKQMGAQSRKTFENHFTVKRMVDALIREYDFRLQ